MRMCDSGVSLSSGAGEASDCDTGGHTVTIQVIFSYTDNCNYTVTIQATVTILTQYR